MTIPDHTHDPETHAWLETANDPASDFPLQNLPFGVFRAADRPRIGVAIGDRVVDLAACVDAGLLALPDAIGAACHQPTLNALLALGNHAARTIRHALHTLLRADAPDRAALGPMLVSLDQGALQLPATIGDYTDFYASIAHATRVGRLFRPDNPLLPNYKFVPIGYHGRASSIVVSGTPIRRPQGQRKTPDMETPVLGPSQLLDYELEVGIVVGTGNALGQPVTIADAPAHIWGLCLVNDWSARDIQSWEYQPLGPFLSKSFATSVSPWIVTADALAPFRVAAATRTDGDPAPLPYLHDERDQAAGGVDITMEVLIETPAMRDAGSAPYVLSHGSFTEMYWTIAQLLTHHTVNGCNLRPADLLASGTVSGVADRARGCLLEITSRGADPVPLPGGETRAFLRDGDTITIRGWCERPGWRRIGFGTVTGTITAAT